MYWLMALVCAVLLGGAVTLWLIGERGHLVLPSTRRVWKDAGFLPWFQLRLWHFYFYGRWPRLYIGFLIHHGFRWVSGLGDRGRRWLADRYHGKVLTSELARKLIVMEHPIQRRDLERVLPYRTARQLIVQTPLEVVVYECPCRLSRTVHCQPTQVCMIAGQPFADLVLEHHPHTSRRLSRDEALALLQAEHERGHVHIAWFKNACLDRFFAICNCCSCCCGGIDAMLHYGIPMVTSSGFVALVDAQKCRACGKCESVCPFAAVHVSEHAEVDAARCQGCGICVSRCGTGALSLRRDATRGAPLDVELLT